MVYLFSSLVFFLLSIFFHVILSHILLYFGKKSILLVSVFAVGGLIHVAVTYVLAGQPEKFDGLFFFPLSVSSSMLYFLFVFIYLVYFLATYSGEESPSLKLFYLLRDEKGRSFSEIKREFPKKEMIDMRIKSLVTGKFVKQNKDKYLILSRGEWLANVFRHYRNLLGWRSSG